jgi:hypothetical protein
MIIFSDGRKDSLVDVPNHDQGRLSHLGLHVQKKSEEFNKEPRKRNGQEMLSLRHLHLERERERATGLN